LEKRLFYLTLSSLRGRLYVFYPVMNFDKAYFREIVNLRAAMFSEKELHHRADIIFRIIEEMPVFIRSSKVMLYWSIKKEVYTHTVVRKWASSKTILLPAVADNNIVPKRFTGEEHLVSTLPFNIMEPQGEPFREEIDLVIVPGIAFDKQGHRIGRGKGFYDRFLKTTSAHTIGVCFFFQLFENLPVMPYDVPVKEVIWA